MREALYIGGMPTSTVCQVHDWPTEGMAERLIERMRASHDKGGVNVCVECITRARASLPKRSEAPR